MKTNIIKPAKLDAVKDALNAGGLPWKITGQRSEKGFGRQRPQGSLSRRGIHRAMSEAQGRGRGRRQCGAGGGRRDHRRGKTGIGDGKVFVSPIEEAIPYRTGEHGADGG